MKCYKNIVPEEHVNAPQGLLVAHYNCFSVANITEGVPRCYGFFADDNKTVYIFPSRFDDVLKKNGYNTMKTKHYLFEHGLIQGRVEKSGKRAFSVVKNYNGGSHRFLAFNLEKYISSQTEMDANYDVAQQTGSE